MHKDLKNIRRDKEKLLIKASKNNVSGTIDDSNTFTPEDEIFSLNRNK